MHNAGIAHLDLRPGNLLLDKNYNLKIVNFVHCKYIRDIGKGIQRSHIGSEMYLAPEIHEWKQYSGVQIDIFASGIILFMLKTQFPPF